jgi:hypothetical protein
MDKDSENRDSYVRDRADKRKAALALHNRAKRQKLGLNDTDDLGTASFVHHYDAPPPVNYVPPVSSYNRPDGSLYNPNATTPRPFFPNPAYEAYGEEPKKRG